MEPTGMYLFATHLRRTRKKENLTTKELSEKIGKSQSYISHLEKGRIKSIDFQLAKKILLELNKQSLLEMSDPKELDNYEQGLEKKLKNVFNIIPKEEMFAKEKMEIERLQKLHDKIDQLKEEMNSDQEYIVDLLIKLLRTKKTTENEVKKQVEENLAKIVFSKEG